MLWWVAVAVAAELQGFQRVWVDGDALSLVPVAPAAGAEISGVALALNPGQSGEPISVAARAASLEVVFEASNVLIQGAAADSLLVEGKPLSDFGTVRRIPALRSHLPGAPNALVIENPTTRRAEVEVNGVLIGRLLPRATGAVVGIPAGSYAVVLTGPDGEKRNATLAAIAANPGMTSPPAATLPGFPPALSQ